VIVEEFDRYKEFYYNIIKAAKEGKIKILNNGSGGAKKVFFLEIMEDMSLGITRKGIFKRGEKIAVGIQHAFDTKHGIQSALHGLIAENQMLNLVDTEINKMSNRYPGLKSPLRYSEGAIDLIQVQRYFEEGDSKTSDDSVAYKYMQFAEAYHVFQLCGIVHYDAKTENTVRDKRYGLQIIDFATIKGKNTRVMEGNTGNKTPIFAGPELFTKVDVFRRAQHDIDYKTDIYSLGADLFTDLLQSKNLSVWNALGPLVEPILKPLLPKYAKIKLSNYKDGTELMHQIAILYREYEEDLEFRMAFQKQLEIMIDHVLGIEKSDLLKDIYPFKEFEGSKHSQSFLKIACSCWFQLLEEERHDAMEVLEFYVARQMNYDEKDRDPLVQLAQILLDNIFGNALENKKNERIAILARMLPTFT
ncbi:hypothetical protein BVX93_00400, partial [bacterium B13(2017)]